MPPAHCPGVPWSGQRYQLNTRSGIRGIDDVMNRATVSYKRRRFPPQIIANAVWLYYRFPLSLRLVEEMLLERGIVVSYETIRRWGIKFGPHYTRRRCHVVCI
ncbi:hypothetical protein MESS4_330053 [Mesorhizobium sp. STM 4661]|nr:hypothetical protein MESS4_330053 [Mesorhizobium sp. STM 4661]